MNDNKIGGWNDQIQSIFSGQTGTTLITQQTQSTGSNSNTLSTTSNSLNTTKKSMKVNKQAIHMEQD